MKYNSTTNLDGIIQEIERMTDLGYATISGDTTLMKEFTTIVNSISSDVWHTIFMSNGNWQYDDSNRTDLPQATTDLVDTTAKYSLPETALTIQRVEVKDTNGDFYIINPLTKEGIPGAVDEFMKDDGVPTYYRLIGNTIELFPAPNYNSTAGLKIYFDRGSVDFTTSDTTATPGFASPYHKIIPIGAAISWMKIKQPGSPSLPILIQDYLKLEDNIKKFYARRWKNVLPTIRRASEIWK